VQLAQVLPIASTEVKRASEARALPTNNKHLSSSLFELKYEPFDGGAGTTTANRLCRK